jgi:hypothetical protein
MRDSSFQIITFIQPTATWAGKVELPLQLETAFFTTMHLPPLVSIEATGVCIPLGNTEVLLAALYKSPGRAWNDADITELLSFRRKFILAGDLNAKHPFWNRAVSDPSGEKLMGLFDLNEF